MSESENFIEFVKGQEAMRNGELCPNGVSQYFIRGYRAQYELEQVHTAQQELAERRRGKK